MARKKTEIVKKKKQLKIRWTDKVIARLRKDAGKLSVSELAAKYDRTAQAIRNRASQEGLSLRLKSKRKKRS
ncbi:MAG: hypothetical protein WDO56_27110 [Gammaproteobacteria bacterium]